MDRSLVISKLDYVSLFETRLFRSGGNENSCEHIATQNLLKTVWEISWTNVYQLLRSDC